MKIEKREIKQDKPKSGQNCNYSENYYGDQVCITQSKQERK